MDKVRHKISKSNKRNFVRFGICMFLILLLILACRCNIESKSTYYKSSYVIENTGEDYDVSVPLIFIGGVPRSGTTLMRSMLDAHPEIRCGEETRIIPKILDMHSQMERPFEKRRLLEAGISSTLMDSILQNFILEVIIKHGANSKYLCNKDPFTLKSTVYLTHLFPNAKFIFMIRDGRAVVNSIINRKVKISGFDIKSQRNCLLDWNRVVKFMNSQCIKAGPEKCMPVYYEQLVLHPEKWMHKILEFLDIPWNTSVLHHQDFVGEPDGISLSRVEPSTDQVIKPVNIGALTTWVGQFSNDVIRDMASIAPMLEVFGYDPYANPPNYGKPDERVKANTMHIQENEIFWEKKEREILMDRNRLLHNSK